MSTRLSIEDLKAKLADSRGLKDTQLTGDEVKALYAAGEREFSRANLRGANLYGANLEGANLEGANLEGAYLRGAYLRGAKYAVAVIGIGETGRYAWAWNTGKSAGVRLGCQEFATFEDAIAAVKRKYDTDEYRQYLPAYLTGLEYMRLMLEIHAPKAEVESEQEQSL